MQTISKKHFIALLALILGLSACGTSPSTLIIFPTDTGGTRYFFPMEEWKGYPKDIGATCDITYRNEPGFPAVYNITFTYTSKSDAGKVPPVPSALTLTGDGVNYALTDIETLFYSAEKRQTRITSQIDGDALFTLLQARSIGLTAVLAGAEYRFTPPKEFFAYRDKVIADIIVRPAQ